MTFNYFVWDFVQPSQLLLVAAVLAAVCWRWRVGRKFAGATVALFLLFGLAPVGNVLLMPLERRFEIPARPANVDGIIVLAGSEQVRLSELYSEPQLSAAGDRLTTFLMLAAAYPDARLAHSGAFESHVARTLIVGAGITSSRVVFEDRARDTCENAAATRELVAPKVGERWLLVTSAAHMPRSVGCFRAADWEVIPYPTDYRTGSTPWSYDVLSNLTNLDLATHEWLGLVYYRLRGYTNDLYPGPVIIEP
jgi:uncharacterized SAM-binding protein YcdF (DUF218 family)